MTCVFWVFTLTHDFGTDANKQHCLIYIASNSDKLVFPLNILVKYDLTR